MNLIRVKDISTCDIAEMLEHLDKVDEFNERYRNSKDWQERNRIIREYYSYKLPMIMEQNGCASNHDLDFARHFSQLELSMDIILSGICAMKMFYQFPVGPYFLDFANPYHKINIEVDGKAYHKKENDEKRDKYLKSLGWDIYRLSWEQVHKPIVALIGDYDSLDDYIEYKMYECDEPVEDGAEFRSYLYERFRYDSGEALANYLHEKYYLCRMKKY